jgi:predicted nucleic acid-binding protein
MRVVVDASAAVEIALNNAEAEKFSRILLEAEMVIAPDIFAPEITNVFWKYGSLSNVPAEQCEKALEYCLDLVDDYVPTRDLCREVYVESMRTKHPAYDIFYVITARRHSASILTKDKKVKKAAEKLGVKIAGTH